MDLNLKNKKQNKGSKFYQLLTSRMNSRDQHDTNTQIHAKKMEQKIILYSLPLTIFTYFSPETLLSLSRFNLQHTPHTLYNT